MTPDKLIGSDRAEDLSPDQVIDLFSGSGGVDDEIAQRLTAPGVFLLQGSRGTGKTMLLRVAFERMRRDTSQRKALPVFVSFTRYLSTFNANAKPHPGYRPFQNWVFAKLLSGIESASFASRPTSVQALSDIPLAEYAGRLETHYQDDSVSDPKKNAAALGVKEEDLLAFARLDQVQQRILDILDRLDLESVTFFLDEAAQSFAEDLQPEFFQLVKHLRHHRISVKAAIYPNTTNFGRDFDIGHDAILLPVERQVETSEGMAFFRDLLRKRFSGTDFSKALGRSVTSVSFLIKMSGGNPRWFIHLLSAVSTSSSTASITPTQAMVAAKQLPDSTLWPYLKKIRENLISKRKYVDTALQLSQTLLEGVRDANKSVRREALERPICYVAVSTHKTVPYRIHAAVKLLQYAGIVSSRGPKKITGRETAEMLLIHPAILVRENALFASETNPPLDAIVTALTDPPREKFREFTRNSPRLLDFREGEDSDTVTCRSCGSDVPENSKYCMECGTPIAQTSPFAELLERPTSELELTPGIKQRVVADGRFPTVKSIVDATDAQLDSIPYIGSERIALIRYAAEEFLAG